MSASESANLTSSENIPSLVHALGKIIASYYSGKPLIYVEFLFIYNTPVTLGAF